MFRKLVLGRMIRLQRSSYHAAPGGTGNKFIESVPF